MRFWWLTWSSMGTWSYRHTKIDISKQIWRLFRKVTSCHIIKFVAYVFWFFPPKEPSFFLPLGHCKWCRSRSTHEFAKGDLNNLDDQIYLEKPTMPDKGVQTNTSMNGVHAIDWCTCFDYKDEEWASHSKCSNFSNDRTDPLRSLATFKSY